MKLSPEQFYALVEFINAAASADTDRALYAYWELEKHLLEGDQE